MHTRPPAEGPRPRATVLSRVGMATSEDPFGPGDPLDVARLVRRALAAAGRKAVDVTELRAVADAPVADDALGRFARRALGPHGGEIPASAQVPVATDPEAALEPPVAGVAVVVVLGPGARATALVLG
ncbi:MAG: hypothetical protein ABWZ82_10125 [Candidatus Limnocylindrales bacterium]